MVTPSLVSVRGGGLPVVAGVHSRLAFRSSFALCYDLDDRATCCVLLASYEPDEQCEQLRSVCLAVADLQMVNITLRVLSKPDVDSLPTIFKASLLLLLLASMLLRTKDYQSLPKHSYRRFPLVVNGGCNSATPLHACCELTCQLGRSKQSSPIVPNMWALRA